MDHAQDATIDRLREVTADAALGVAGWTRHLPVALGFLLLAAVLGVGIVQQGGGLTGGGGLRAGAVAPDFPLTTFDGRTVRLGDYRGRPVVLNFWASWCPPCREEAPALGKVAKAETDAGRAVFLGVDVRDKESNARRFLSEFGVPYANGPDPGGVEGRYRGLGIPYTVFIGPDGTVERTWIGPLDEQRLTAFIDEVA